MTANQGNSQLRSFYYSPLSFLREKENELSASFLVSLQETVKTGETECIGDNVRLWLRYLNWDSQYFGCPTYRLEFAEWDSHIMDPIIKLSELLIQLKTDLSLKHHKFYLFAEIPSEDITVLQALGLTGFQLQETRLSHYIKLKNMDEQVHRQVREATLRDISHLREVAMQARNNFDRFHADSFFSDEVADTYIAEYIEQCIRGLTDVVLVPDCDNLLPNAFICGSFNIKSVDEIKIGRLVLVAVGNSRRGWYRDLNKALLMMMKEKGMSYCVNTTQSTNRAVIHVCEQLGYQYGRSTHIFSTNQ